MLFLKNWTLENRENTTVSAAILYPAACISDVIKTARMRGKSTNQVTLRLFLFLASLVKSESTWLRPEKLKFEAKKYIQGYKGVYSPVILKCIQEFVLVTFQSYSALTKLIHKTLQLTMYKNYKQIRLNLTMQQSHLYIR